MGNILWRFMKASPGTVGWAVGTLVWAIIVQLAILTVTGFARYHTMAENPQVYDYIWFVYREMPSTLPMVFVYSGATAAIMLSVGIYVRIGFTMRDLPHAARHHPLRFIWEVAVPPLCAAGLLANLLFEQRIIMSLSITVLAAFVSAQLVGIWITWARIAVRLTTEEEHVLMSEVLKRISPPCCDEGASQSQS